jgi:serine/threonine-protein kinase
MLARRGARFGKYVLEARVGSGAFSEVWRAHDPIERRRVALKLVPPSIVSDLGRDTVEHEARVATRLVHPHVMAIRHADWIGDFFVLAMELARGSLLDYARAKRSTPTALRLLRQVASGLAYAHEKRVMHRDIKPENVLILSDGRAVISDFGHARARLGLTRARTYVGTIGYTAPEQAYGRPRLASDVFSFGMVAYQLLASDLPTWPFEWPLEGHGRLVRRV